MKTFTALVTARVGNAQRIIKTDIRADSAAEAKWLLQAIYGFHALGSMPVAQAEVLTREDQTSPPSPEQQKIKTLQATKDRAADALKAERNRQRRQSALKTLQKVNI